MINLLFTISTAEGGFVLLLEDLIVHQEHRHRGFGDMLLDYSVNFAREKNFLRITLLTDRANEEAHKFFKAHGFLDSKMIPLRMFLQATHRPGQPIVSFVDLGFARVDTDRRNRRGFPEVIFCAGKLPGAGALHRPRRSLEADGVVLGTRATPEHFAGRRSRSFRTPDSMPPPAASPSSAGRCRPWWARVAVVCAGTSDIPVAEEAAVTLETFGSAVDRISDVGVAGIHRLLAVRDRLEACNAVIVAAGMEGALPSAVAGLISKPVIAVPTSVGYGASFGGIAALLGMLNSCGSGVTVVNIDNGFGAAYAAANISRLLSLNRTRITLARTARARGISSTNRPVQKIPSIPITFPLGHFLTICEMLVEVRRQGGPVIRRAAGPRQNEKGKSTRSLPEVQAPADLYQGGINHPLHLVLSILTGGLWL